ncbi:DUF6527 family protein [Phenylobacterium sp.]|uniref:DUF6527 family protein n=1 Tax=Phenylobacterium sp. TaxID=1871053 RepID=UPI0034296AEF
MSVFGGIWRSFAAFGRWLAGSSAQPRAAPHVREVHQPPYFDAVTHLDRTPPNEAVQPQRFYLVEARGESYWALFRCPCACGEVVNLPLRAPHQPRWRVTSDGDGRPTLHPSVWRNRGCLSHFWIRQGRVIFCNDTGLEPWKVRPDLYSPPRM